MIDWGEGNKEQASIMARRQRTILTDEQVSILKSIVVRPTVARVTEFSASRFGVDLARIEATRVTKLLREYASEGERGQLRVSLPKTVRDRFAFLCWHNGRSAVEQMTAMIHAASEAASTEYQSSRIADPTIQVTAARMLVPRESRKGTTPSVAPTQKFKAAPSPKRGRKARSGGS